MGESAPQLLLFWTNEKTIILPSQDMQRPIMWRGDKRDELVTEETGIRDKYWNKYSRFLISNRGINF